MGGPFHFDHPLINNKEYSRSNLFKIKAMIIERYFLCINNYKFYGLIFFIVISIGCTRASQTLFLSNNNPGIIEPSEDIYILKIDDTEINVRPQNDLGSEYYNVAVMPGSHEIVVDFTLFGEGSKFFLKVFVVAGRKYVIKYKVGDRKSWLFNIWYCSVWVEDVGTGEIVSSVIKNL